MADLLKNMYNKDYLERLATNIKAAHSPFEAEKFVASVMDETWDSLELKGRMRQITVNLHKFLPQDYPTAIGIITEAIKSYTNWLDGFCLYFPDYVELYGQDQHHWEISMTALAFFTQYASGEFAVRPFIINHEEKMMAQMRAWSKSENPHVRRLSCEGCRPALPWAQALPKFKKDPTPVIPILETLKADPDLYVRKSVANNLNDISKTHPQLVVEIAQKWYGKNPDTDWIVKHACRTLLKKANRDALKIFGFGDGAWIDVAGFAINKTTVKIGDEFEFSFEICTNDATKIRLEYAIDFAKAKGKQSRKVFQISEQDFAPGKKAYVKTHSFADLSTRKHYAGAHAITLIVNGAERGTLEFEII